MTGEMETRAWLALGKVHGLGPVGQRRLLEHFGSGVAALQASASEWARLAGKGVARPGHSEQQWAEKQWRRMARLRGRIIGLTEAGYPELLRHIHDPPPVLYALGAAALARPALAIVGTRRATPYGLRVARELAFALTKAGLQVISGMALGIDAAAHTGALEAGGDTVAVLGCGVDVVYPPSHVALYRRMLRSGGAVISEMPVGAGPDRGSFPRRNRIISGLCLGVIVVEAAARSGALITARCAGEQGREVFAVPGPIGNSSAGCHALIKDGAKLVEGVDDVLQELPAWIVAAPQSETVAPPGAAGQVYGLLRGEPRHIDELAREGDMAAQQVLGLLLELELEGLAAQYPGKRFARRA